MMHGDIVEFCMEDSQWRPAMLVRVWNHDCAQIQVFPDLMNDGVVVTDEHGRHSRQDPLGTNWFRSSAMRGSEPGQWRPRREP